MRTILRCWGVVAVMLFTWLPATAQQTGGTGELNLTGVWNGDAAQADDWGVVQLKSTENGYIGTYSATFNRKPGSVTFHKTAAGQYAGLWWESDLQRYGSCELKVSQDGQTIRMTWKALDDRAGTAKSGQSTWEKRLQK